MLRLVPPRPLTHLPPPGAGIGLFFPTGEAGREAERCEP